MCKEDLTWRARLCLQQYTDQMYLHLPSDAVEEYHCTLVNSPLCIATSRSLRRVHQRRRWLSVRSLRGPTQWRTQLYPLQQVQR